jgi:hypothetical protein
MKNLRQLVAGSMLGLAGIAIAGDYKIDSIREVQPVYDQNFQEKTKDGFSVVLFYSSRPSDEKSKNISDLTTKMYVQLVNDIPTQFYRFDLFSLTDVVDHSELNEHMIDHYGFDGAPSLVAYCNGEKVYLLENCNPRDNNTVVPVKDFIKNKVLPLRDTCLE